MGTVLFMLIFLICWLILMVNGVLAMWTKVKLNKVIKARHVGVRRKMSVFDSNSHSLQLNSAVFSVFGLMFSFGSKAKARSYWDNFVDVDAIDESEDNEMKGFLNKLINLSSSFSVIWVVMMISLGLCALTWPIK